MVLNTVAKKEMHHLYYPFMLLYQNITHKNSRPHLRPSDIFLVNLFGCLLERLLNVFVCIYFAAHL